MKRGRSTGNPTKAESARIVAAKEGRCICCLILHERGELDEQMIASPCDYHHPKSGNIRRGHRFGFALCRWHHERHPWGQWTHRQMAKFYGVSLKDGSALFHRTYGSDDELIARQDALLGWTDIGEKAA